ncbi:uncharacterized protein [Clytia hemisphaerica]
MSSHHEVTKGNILKNNPRLKQTRLSMGPVVLNNALPASFTRRATRAEIMVAGAPTVLGHDSTTKKERLPEQWVLVDEINVEGRSDNKQRLNWRECTSKQMDYLSKQLRTSLAKHPHQMLSNKAKEELKKFL